MDVSHNVEGQLPKKILRLTVPEDMYVVGRNPLHWIAANLSMIRPAVASFRHLACNAALALWFVFCVVGFAMLVSYSQTPGVQEQPPLAASGPESPASAAYRMVVAIHPKCVCSRATAKELAKILRDNSAKIACQILMYQPADASSEFGETWLMRQLAELPNTTISVDSEGRQAASLGMHTSGAVVLYGAAREPLFYGGITAARGHEGDSVGSESILSLVQNNPPITTCTKVYGCPLQSHATLLEQGD